MIELQEIKKYVEEYTGVKIDTPLRKPKNAFARACYSHIAEKTTNYTLREIGSVINRHHSSILHYRSLVDEIYNDEYYQGLLKCVDPVLVERVKDHKTRAEHYRVAYIELKNELEKIKDTFSHLEPHEMKYRELPEEAKEQFKTMAEAKLRMLKVKHEIK